MAQREPPPLDVAALLRWPAVMAEEMLRLPDTMRQYRLFLTETVRALHNLNDSAEMLLRIGRRIERLDPGRLSSAEPVADALARMPAIEDALEDIRDRMGTFMGGAGRAARRAFDVLRTPPPVPPASRLDPFDLEDVEDVEEFDDEPE